MRKIGTLASRKMIQQAKKIDANAIIGARFVTSMLMSGAGEMVAYGIAVKVA